MVLTHEASARATGTTKGMSLQRRSRPVGDSEATAVLFDRGKTESTMGQISVLLLMRGLFVQQQQQHRLGYLKDLLDTRRKVSSRSISFCNEINVSPLLAPRCYSTLAIIFAVVVMPEAR